MTPTDIYLNDLGIICAVGTSVDEVRNNLVSSNTKMTYSRAFHQGEPLPIGIVDLELPKIPLTHNKWQSRNNQMALFAFQQIVKTVDEMVSLYGRARVGVVIGTSTSGIDGTERAIKCKMASGEMPDTFDYGQQEMGAPAQFIAEVAKLTGPAYGISTACSSGAKALASAKRLIEAGICDAVIAGGVDTMCKLTVQGFSALQAVSNELCAPFSADRKGINIGEGAALFVVSKKQATIALLGYGESSDAHHISAPEPKGVGAIQCMRESLKMAELSPEQIAYINLHGTATQLNDQMESTAVNTVFGEHVLCSSTKPFTGHTLGAAGAIEAGICYSVLGGSGKPSYIPVQINTPTLDPSLAKINLASNEKCESVDVSDIKYVLSNSFAFGGNNISLVLGRNK